MGYRRAAREAALKILFQFDFNPSDAEELIASFWRGHKASDRMRAFAEHLVWGVLEHRDEIDRLIGEAAENWRLERMSAVDRNVLRLATFEMLYLPDIPPQVSIDEAIELGKRFGSEDSGAFINGILDRIALDQNLLPPRERVEEDG